MTAVPTPRSELLAGMRDTLPMVAGSLPFGIIFGALAANAGLSPFGAQAMSLFVFAGSAQFIAVGLVAQNVSALFIVVTTFVVNLRHALYSAALAPYLRQVKARWLPLLGFTLTDETFVIVSKRFEERGAVPYGQWYFFGSSAVMYTDWQLCTLAGIVVGKTIPNPQASGLDFAATVTFTGMVVSMVRSLSTGLAVIVAGAVAMIANPLPNRLGLMLAAMAGAVAGVIGKSLFREAQAAEGGNE
jgi:4-azaleucine resistance transporter AzlC